MPLYQIKDWDAFFENDRSRNRIQCSFVCVPNKQHGMGFCRIMAEVDGAAIYGIWHCIVGACSQQRKRNGWLTPDGDKAVSGWGVEDLALKFRRPESEIARDRLPIDRVPVAAEIVGHRVGDGPVETLESLVADPLSSR